MIDPVLQLVLRAALSLLFGAAAAHKLRDVESFRHALEDYDLLPPLWAVPAGAGAIAVELGIAVALWLPRVSPFAGMAAAALLAVYGAAIAVNLARGRRDLDCGCFGPARRRPITSVLVVRNAVLAAAALASALPSQSRSLTWMDGVTIVAGVSVVALLYTAIDGLLATAGDGSPPVVPMPDMAHD